jgi:hypothetical protein
LNVPAAELFEQLQYAYVGRRINKNSMINLQNAYNAYPALDRKGKKHRITVGYSADRKKPKVR